MALEDHFPEDPTKPSLRYAVTTHVALVIPWTTETVLIGAPFMKEVSSLTPASGGQTVSKFEFGTTSAFDQGSLLNSRLVLNQRCTGTFSDASAGGSSSSHESLNVDFSGSIGGKVLGAPARGQFSKRANQDQGTNKASVQSVFRAGKVTLAEFPRLSDEAVQLLRTADEPSQAFSQRYGEYFVGGCILGGSNSTIAWDDSSSKSASDSLDVSFEIHLLFFSYEDSYHDDNATSSSALAANLAAFDSLSDWHTDVSACTNLQLRWASQASRENRLRGYSIQRRAKEKLKELGLRSSGGDTAVPWSRCADLFAKGLVLELLLLPWDGLRDYHCALLAGR